MIQVEIEKTFARAVEMQSQLRDAGFVEFEREVVELTWASRKVRYTDADLALELARRVAVLRQSFDAQCRAWFRTYLDSAPNVSDAELTEAYLQWYFGGEYGLPGIPVEQPVSSERPKLRLIRGGAK